MGSFGKTFRDVYSMCILIFSTIIVMALVFSENTKIAKDVHPVVAFIGIWISIIWLCMVEGGQASLVGLPPVDMELYKESHPTSHKIMTVVNRGDNLDRYLMGRQFMVLALVFLEHICGAPLDEDEKVLNLPSVIIKIFLGSGLALFFMTAMIGKISAQVNASRCMLDYVNNYFGYFTFQVARGIEFSGLLHCCYLAQIFFSWAAGKPLESNEPPRSATQSFFFWTRVAVSTAILAYSFAVTLSALFNEQTTMWDGVPAWLSVVLFFFFMSIVGMLEGMQIAFFAVAKMTDEERSGHLWAKRVCDVLFEGDGRNLPGFMVGRQMCVTMCFFIVARVTTINLKDGDDNIFGVADPVQQFFDTGLMGALITTIVASITWQLVASAFPMAFLNNPVSLILLKFCLFLEWTGICQGAWVVALAHRKAVGFMRDEVYIGTAEERAIRAKNDPQSVCSAHSEVRAGHLYPGPNLPPGFHHEGKTIDELNELEEELQEHLQDVKRRLEAVQSRQRQLTHSAKVEETTKDAEDP